MQRKKSRFWLFIFSFIPGAGEMYMGFMRMGLSLMLVFMVLSSIVGYTNLGVLVVFPVTLYIYSFFHANNLGSLDDVTFHNIEDQYLFGLDGIGNRKMKLEGRNRKIAAVILIVLGVMMLWQVIFNLLCDIFGWDNRFLSAIYYFVRDDLPRMIVGIAVIWVGFALIRGKRTEIEEKEYTDDGQSVHRERNYYADPYETEGQPPYREQPVAGGYQDLVKRQGMDGQHGYPDRPVNGQMFREDRIQRVVDGSVIYAQGPVEDGYGSSQNADGDRNRETYQ